MKAFNQFADIQNRVNYVASELHSAITNYIDSKGGSIIVEDDLPAGLSSKIEKIKQNLRVNKEYYIIRITPVHLPMSGWVNSFNISVRAAIEPIKGSNTLYTVTTNTGKVFNPTITSGLEVYKALKRLNEIEDMQLMLKEEAAKLSKLCNLFKGD